MVEHFSREIQLPQANTAGSSTEVYLHCNLWWLTAKTEYVDPSFRHDITHYLFNTCLITGFMVGHISLNKHDSD